MLRSEDIAGVEYPRVQYDKDGQAKRVEKASQALDLGMDWQYRPDGTHLFPEAPAIPSPKTSKKPKE